MIVVAMVGVLAALAIVGYRKYLNSAQASEAKAIIQGIRAGEESYKSEMLVYLSCSGSLTDYYPHNPTVTQNDSRMNWIQPADVRYSNGVNGWQLLNVSSDGPVRFGYAVVAGIGPAAPPALVGYKVPIVWPAINPGIPWYVVQAANQRSPTSSVVLFVSSSLGGEIYGENEEQ